ELHEPRRRGPDAVGSPRRGVRRASRAGPPAGRLGLRARLRTDAADGDAREALPGSGGGARGRGLDSPPARLGRRRVRTRAQLSAWTLSAAVREANACGRKSIAGFASGLLLLAAAVLFGHGAWIYAKASLAQILLRRAWAKTVDSGRPAAPWPWADTWPIARLRAPGLRGDVIVLAGSSGRTLAFSPRPPPR